MRPLTVERSGIVNDAIGAVTNGIIFTPESKLDFEQNLASLRVSHHSECLFNRQPPIIPALRFWFDDSGRINGEFKCNRFQQGYDNMVHGGVIASIIDASMAQCLMGHGVIGYTTKLSIKYRKPVAINTVTFLSTTVKEIRIGCMYTLKCEIHQENKCAVQATGEFYKVNKNE